MSPEDYFCRVMDDAGIRPSQSKVLVAVSGGVDSMVLLYLLHTQGFSGRVAHVNYGLRGKDSAADEKLVRENAEQLGWPVDVLDAGEQMKEHKGESTQMTARSIRYAFFSERMKEHHLGYCLLGHQADDQVETFFINLLRGSGSRGLSGMETVRGLYVRPLLSFGREEILAYAREKGIPWREDRSNSEDRYLRNRIRHHLLPELAKLSPAFLQKMPETFTRLKRERSLLDHFLARELKVLQLPGGKGFRIPKDFLGLFPDPAFALYELIRETGFSYLICRLACTNLTHTHGQLFRAGAWMIYSDRSVFFVRKGIQDVSVRELPPISAFHIENITEIPDYKDKMPVSLAYVDADKLCGEFSVRTWRKGDHFWPSGMKGRKKISDYFTDMKLSAAEKSSQLLLLSGDAIVWVVNRRIDGRFAATRNSKNILRITFSGSMTATEPG